MLVPEVLAASLPSFASSVPFRATLPQRAAGNRTDPAGKRSLPHPRHGGRSHARYSHHGRGALFFSIIVPVYNRERLIGRCVASVLSQDVDDFELILVDDGS